MAGFYYGAWTQARTGDPRFFRAMLYQLSYPGRLTYSARLGLRKSQKYIIFRLVRQTSY